MTGLLELLIGFGEIWPFIEATDILFEYSMFNCRVKLPPFVESRCPLCDASKALAVFSSGRLYPPRVGVKMQYGPMGTVL